jgi:L-serine deaminase
LTETVSYGSGLGLEKFSRNWQVMGAVVERGSENTKALDLLMGVVAERDFENTIALESFMRVVVFYKKKK